MRPRLRANDVGNRIIRENAPCAWSGCCQPASASQIGPTWRRAVSDSIPRDRGHLVVEC